MLSIYTCDIYMMYVLDEEPVYIYIYILLVSGIRTMLWMKPDTVLYKYVHILSIEYVLFKYHPRTSIVHTHIRPVYQIQVYIYIPTMSVHKSYCNY